MIDTVALLLADRSPVLRYRALTELDGLPSDDPEVAQLASEVPSCDEVTGALASPGAGAHQWSFTLCRLAYFGIAKGHPFVDSLAEKIFATQKPDGSWPIQAWASEDLAKDAKVNEGYEWRPMQVAIPLRGLCAAGYATDQRAERAFEWLLDRRNEDGSWPYGKTAGRKPGNVVGYRRLPGSVGCRTTTTGALTCLAHHPVLHTSAEARGALDVLMGRETREESTLGFEVSRLLGVERASGLATFFAKFDLALLLDLATRVGVARDDPRTADLVAFLESKRGPIGLWDHPVHPHLSRWLTLDILASLKRLDAGEWIGTDRRQSFTAYPKRRKRY